MTIDEVREKAQNCVQAGRPPEESFRHFADNLTIPACPWTEDEIAVGAIILRAAIRDDFDLDLEAAYLGFQDPTRCGPLNRDSDYLRESKQRDADRFGSRGRPDSATPRLSHIDGG